MITPAEFRSIRERLGLTRRALAALLQITATSVYRKETGRQLITERDSLAMRALASHHRSPSSS
jgi:DNA-binding transcriptional regulator YiaG